MLNNNNKPNKFKMLVDFNLPMRDVLSTMITTLTGNDMHLVVTLSLVVLWAGIASLLEAIFNVFAIVAFALRSNWECFWGH